MLIGILTGCAQESTYRVLDGVQIHPQEGVPLRGTWNMYSSWCTQSDSQGGSTQRCSLLATITVATFLSCYCGCIFQLCSVACRDGAAVSSSLQEMLVDAQQQGRLTCGIYDSGTLLAKYVHQSYCTNWHWPNNPRQCVLMLQLSNKLLVLLQWCSIVDFDWSRNNWNTYLNKHCSFVFHHPQV